VRQHRERDGDLLAESRASVPQRAVVDLGLLSVGLIEEQLLI
jgi:hypothetical protein